MIDLPDLRRHLEALSTQLLNTTLAMEKHFCRIEIELVKIRAVMIGQSSSLQVGPGPFVKSRNVAKSIVFCPSLLNTGVWFF